MVSEHVAGQWAVTPTWREEHHVPWHEEHHAQWHDDWHTTRTHSRHLAATTSAPYGQSPLGASLQEFTEYIRSSLAALPALGPQAFASKVHQISGVRAVYAKVDKNQTVHCWTVLERDEAVPRAQVYDMEMSMYELFPNTRFDFYVFAWDRLQSQSLANVIPDGFDEVAHR